MSAGDGSSRHRRPTPQGDLPIAELAGAVAGLGLPFVTVDLAVRSDGAWRVIGLGDGQVSDRPATTSAEALVNSALPDQPSGPRRQSVASHDGHSVEMPLEGRGSYREKAGC